MFLLEITDGFTYRINAIAFILAIIISIYCYAACKQYLAQVQREEMLDQFLKD